MSLHAISVFDKVQKRSPEKNLHFKNIKCFKEVKKRQLTGFTILISHHRLVCYNKPSVW